MAEEQSNAELLGACVVHVPQLVTPTTEGDGTATRLFEFAVEVVPGPSETAFRMTKAVILLPKHMVENQTGMVIEIKQLGTSDPTLHSLDVQHRCARLLGINERCDVILFLLYPIPMR